MADNNTIKEKIDPFAASQAVWLIDENRLEIDRIQSSLAAEVLTFTDFDAIVDAVNTRLGKSEDGYGTLILSENIPSGLKAQWGTLINGINTLKNQEKIKDRLFVYEINKGSDVGQVINAKVYENVDDFLAAAHNVHFDSITSSEMIDDEAKKIIQQLQIDKDKNRQIVKQQNAEIKKLTEERDSQIQIVQSLNEQIQSYKAQAEKGKLAQEEAAKLISENQVNVDSKQLLIDKLNKQINDANSRVSQLEVEIAAKDGVLKQQNAQIASLKQENIDAQLIIDNQNKEKTEILNARGEMEQTQILVEKLNAEQVQKNDLRKQLEAEKQKNVQNELTIDSLKKQNNDIREGYRTYDRLGYSADFDTIKLTRTNLLYFKVINPLPFHKFYLKELQNMFRELIYDNAETHSKTIKTVYMKVDYGLDDKIIGDYPLISNLSQINDDHDFYRLLPSQNMNDDIAIFEQKDYILIFVDYIDNNSYYVESDGKIDYYSIVHREVEANLLDLRGKVISYDRTSLIDMKYNDLFNSMTEKNKVDTVQKTVSPLLLSSQVLANKIRSF